ncbi:MAG: HoxN/HupN/NixA family nickel/cobalt transporter, partial [Chloroflexi bacterium]
AAAQGLPFAAIMSLPLIFAAGMSLMDTMDGAFMAKAYTWAFASPIRKVFYNMTITSLSVFVALFIGVIELTQILIQVLGLHGGIYSAIATSNMLVYAGYVIVAAFVITWAAALVIYRVRRIDERWGAIIDKVA